MISPADSVPFSRSRLTTTQAATAFADMEPAAASNQPRTSQPTGQFNLSGIGRSAFTAVPPTSGLYPDLALFSQFNHLFPQGSAGGIDPSVLSLLGQQQQQQQQQAQQQQQQQQQQQASAGQTEAARASGARGKPKAGDNKTSSAYASRHQAAEQRRRTRINDRYCRHCRRCRRPARAIPFTPKPWPAYLQVRSLEAGCAPC